MATDLHDIISRFLDKTMSEGEADALPRDEFTEALSAMWARRQLDDAALKSHFQKLDNIYGKSVQDILTTHEVFNDEAVTTFMKAALDEAEERSPEDIDNFNTSVIPDDVIRDFLKGD